MFSNGGVFARRLGNDPYALDRRAHKAAQDREAEIVHIRPQITKPNWPTMPDPSRPLALNVRATFEWEAGFQRIGMRETEIVTRKPRLILMRCDLPYDLVRGDQIERCRDGTLFEAEPPEYDGFSGVSVRLIQLGLSR